MDLVFYSLEMILLGDSMLWLHNKLHVLEDLSNEENQ